eukprot:2120780-Pleurochrysis_carterae.AAC.1
MLQTIKIADHNQTPSQGAPATRFGPTSLSREVGGGAGAEGSRLPPPTGDSQNFRHSASETYSPIIRHWESGDRMAPLTQH